MADPENRPEGELGRPAFLALSFLSLFLEVLLIRWCGSEIRILAYLKNLTLLGCFLGLGLGYAAAARRRLSLAWTFVATALLVGGALPQLAERGLPSFRSLSQLLNFSDVQSWRTGSSDGFRFALGLGLLLVLYALLAVAFVPIGQALGAHFRAVPAERRVREYTWNVVASLAGIAAFGALSFVEASPLAWFAVACVAALAGASTRNERLASGVLALGVAGLLATAEAAKPALEGDVMRIPHQAKTPAPTRWSPYQKIQLVEESYSFPRPATSALASAEELARGPARLEWTDWSAYVNGHWYSRVATTDLETGRLRAAYAGSTAHFDPQRALHLPYRLAPRHDRVLLLGAGMGRDAATALSEGAREIDCVEIEPSFVAWGKELHPQHPYSDPRVRLHVDDARRFLRTAPRGHYDLVVFCYLDAHSLTSNFTNTNLDSYVYTRESLAEARATLAPDGVLALGFWSPRDFVYRRLEGLLEETFGAPPFRVKESLFLAGNEPQATLRGRIQAAPELRSSLSPLASAAPGAERPPGTTDDWPFFYLERASVPWLVRAVLAAVAILSAIVTWAASRGASASTRGPGLDWHFLLLGAAFMLVETWAISRASLVYGATWYVSSAVIASLLVAVLAANARVERAGPVALRWAFPGLLVALLFATLVDPSRLLDLPRAAQLGLAAPLYALPFLFASAIFASSFARAERPDAALASNLLGSVLGGALECLSYATGLRSLGFVALGLYALAWAAARPRSPDGGSRP